MILLGQLLTANCLMHRNVSVLNACGIKKIANDDAESIDAVAVCRGGAGKIKLSEDALAIGTVSWPLENRIE
jgi:hypothetical protein